MQALSILKCSEKCLNLIDMTPKEKAKELVSRFYFEHIGDTYIFHQTIEESKRCALILVNEILDSSLYYFDEMDKYVIYYQQVKYEIEKI